MQTNLLKAKLKSIAEEAKTASEDKKRQLRMQYAIIQRQVRTIEGKKKTFTDVVVEELF